MTFQKSSYTRRERFRGKHRFEHWYRDNQVYFITSKCREGRNGFESEAAKAIFWDRFDHYTHAHGFTPWVTTLLNNHYHVVGYCRRGRELGPMMRKLHGSVAKLVNDTLPTRHVPFWRERGNKDYFDGCLRDAIQGARAYRYTLLQSVRARVCEDWRAYPHTRVAVDLDRALKRASQLGAFMENVPYPRYDGSPSRSGVVT